LSIAKVDIDVIMGDALLKKFIYTRIAIIERLGYTLVAYRCSKTGKGYHFWFELGEKLTDDELCDLQFLLGDDQPRCRYNYLRLEAGMFKQFNALFSKKFKKKEVEAR
jgi:hypothetical protein